MEWKTHSLTHSRTLHLEYIAVGFVVDINTIYFIGWQNGTVGMVWYIIGFSFSLPDNNSGISILYQHTLSWGMSILVDVYIGYLIAHRFAYTRRLNSITWLPSKDFSWNVPNEQTNERIKICEFLCILAKLLLTKALANKWLSQRKSIVSRIACIKCIWCK